MRSLTAFLSFIAALAFATGANAAPGLSDGCVPADIPVREGFVTSSDGTRIYYRKLGRGRPIAIYLHGGPGGTIYNGGCELASLARTHPLILYDQRGGGQSELVSDPVRLTWRHHVQDLESLRRHFGLRRVALIGHSWGTAIATLYADAHPQRVSRLLLAAVMPVAKTPYDRIRDEALFRAASPALFEGRRAIQRQMQSAKDDEVIRLCRRLFTELPLPYVLNPAGWSRRHLTGCDYPAAVIRNRAVVNRASIQSLGDWDFRPALRRLNSPLLVVEGTQSVIPLSLPRHWAMAAKDARFLKIDNAGHEIGVDQPEALVDAARRFLDGRYPAAAERVSTAD